MNNLNIEVGCSWAVPRDTWTNDDRNYTEPELPKTNNNQKETSKYLNNCVRKWRNISFITQGSLILTLRGEKITFKGVVQ